MDIQVGDKLKMKKKHPCGSTEWDVLRVGIDFRLKCCGCGHMIMVARKQAEKNIRQVIKPDSTENDTNKNHPDSAE
ncbi:MAG: DUF951 domain-containing protein [Lachnospiraceae bacterium]|nr:DUF951 domain-containing protein [Lachnospiraceae bacterium]